MFAVRDGAKLDRPLRVAVIGGGPAGACTAETLAEGGIETYLIERKLDNCKVCGGQTLSFCPVCSTVWIMMQAGDFTASCAVHHVAVQPST